MCKIFKTSINIYSLIDYKQAAVKELYKKDMDIFIICTYWIYCKGKDHNLNNKKINLFGASNGATYDDLLQKCRQSSS